MSAPQVPPDYVQITDPNAIVAEGDLLEIYDYSVVPAKESIGKSFDDAFLDGEVKLYRKAKVSTTRADMLAGYQCLEQDDLLVDGGDMLLDFDGSLMPTGLYEGVSIGVMRGLSYRVYRKMPTAQHLNKPEKAPTTSSLEQATNLVLGERNASYGDPAPEFQNVAKAWSGIVGRKLKEDLSAADVALMMTALKLCREAFRHKHDNLVDAHGYLLCQEWIVTGEKPQPVKAQ